MADFATWVTAAEPALGWARGTFLADYTANRDYAIDIGLEATPLATALFAFLDTTRMASGRWRGTASELLTELTSLVDETARRLRSWPSTPNKLRGELKRLTPTLRSRGIEIVLAAKANGRRLIEISRAAQP
jgi:putative DNA primase/helicase